MKKNFIFNTNIKDNMTFAELLIILEIKYYILSTRRINGTLSLAAFKNGLRYTILSLKKIAIKNKNMDTFNADWNTLLNILQT